jgi:HAD superfamily hydrolase (TIGR01509 family)
MEQSMVKAVLCDMDGTLLDSNTAHAESWQRCFEKFGIHATVGEVQRQIGKGGDQMLPVFVDKARLREIEEPLKECKKKLFQDEYMEHLVPFPQARELMETIADAGIRIAMASSAAKDELAKYLEIVGIAGIVEHETSNDDAETSKPEPDIFQAALDKLKLAPEEAIALGDTPWDAQAAGRAGIRTIGVECGGWAEEDLRKAGCIEVYRDPADMLAHLKHSKLIKR